MQVVRVEFETDYRTAQDAVDTVSSLLPNLRLCSVPGIVSWDIESVDESVTHMVSHPVEDGKVMKNVK